MSVHSSPEAFPPDYHTSRALFRQAARQAGLHLSEHPLPHAELDLSIDVATLGDERCAKAVIISSGLHGVEGFVGAAIQHGFLRKELASHPVRNLRLVFIHALNPFGFHSLRRTNEENVDLNRNFLLAGEEYTGSPELYWQIDRLLNLSGPSQWTDFFLLKVLIGLRRFGNARMRDAIAGGQYDNPHGLFYGGSKLSLTGQYLRDHLREWVGQAQEILHVDIHSGLGSWGRYKLIVDHDWDSPGLSWLAERFGAEYVEPSEPERGISYHKRGGLGPWTQELLRPSRYDLLIAEFGTYPMPLVLAALRAENQWWQRSRHRRARGRLIQALLREAFAPRSQQWRARVLTQGLQLIHRTIEVCLRDEAPQRPVKKADGFGDAHAQR
jgi:hypothetical protein